MYMPFSARQNRPKNEVRFFFNVLIPFFSKGPFTLFFAIFNAKKKSKNTKIA
jgi:hypothetical protein